MNTFNIISTLWLLTCFILTTLGIVFKSPGPEYDGGIYYIAFTLLFLVVVLALHNKKLLESFELPIGVFIFGVVTLLFSEPLYENDHYRYLWEGNALFRGENPYLHPPNSSVLDHLVFSGRERIGFDHLTTVYPPIGIIWFGIGGIFGLDIGLRVLMVLNAVLVFFCFSKLKSLVKPWMLVAVFPIMGKEFIQAIHIDLLAAFFFLLFLTQKKKNFSKSLIFIFFSIWTKILGVAAIPFLLFKSTSGFKESIKRIIPLTVVASSLPLFMHWMVGLEKLKGLREFTIDWVWNPGFYSILTRVLDIMDDEARQITAYFYAGFIIMLGIFCLRELLKKNWNFEQEFCLKMFYLIFAGLMFFTPVYNGWYAIWFMFPAMLLGLNTGVIYGIFSVFCYTHYGFADYHWVGELLTHIWFPISVHASFWKNQQVRSEKS
ncbi:MAG: hypothetical protein CME70_17205 [Halobacteriovorax sp.]|nr:hypothetical protein [Halobacteriovorax sp.]